MIGVVMAVFLLLAAATQPFAGLPAWFGHAHAPLLLCVALCYALNRSPTPALVAALAAGFAQDALSDLPLGYSVAAFVVTAWAVGRFRESIERDHVLPLALIGGVASFGATLALGLVAVSSGALSCPRWLCLWRALWSGALGMPVLPVLCAIVGRIERRVGGAAEDDETMEVA